MGTKRSAVGVISARHGSGWFGDPTLGRAMPTLRLEELAKQAGLRPDELREYLRRETG